MRPPSAILRKLSWSANEGVFRQILALGFFFWIARYVGPADLGIFSMGLAIHHFASLLIDEPVIEILIQREETSQSDWSTGFWFNLAISITVFTLFIGAAPYLAEWLSIPEIAQVVPALALCMVIGSLGNIHKAVLYRDLQLKTIAGIALTAQAVAGSVAVAMAANGFGYFSFVANLGVAAATSTILFWFFCRWRPSLSLSLEIVRAFLAPMMQLASLRTVWLLRDQGMLLLIGVVAGAQLLGYVTLAYRVTRSVGQLFEDLTNRAVLSLVSRNQADPAAFRRTVLQVLHLVALAALPAYAGLTLLGPDLILLMFGSQWIPAGDILPYVVGFYAVTLANHFLGIILRAKGAAAAVVRISGPPLLIDLLIVWLLAGTDLRAMFLTLVLRNLAVTPLFYIAARRAGDFTGGAILSAVATPMAGTLAMYGSVLLVRGQIAGMTTLVYCFTIMAVAVVTYAACIAAFRFSRIGSGRAKEPW